MAAVDRAFAAVTGYDERLTAELVAVPEDVPDESAVPVPADGGLPGHRGSLGANVRRRSLD
ncbi:hypothetical protein [Pseudonocardia xishanensis]|uniref:Uncharacterized protein n=1 Tax=Pseudonocardia xishanensis TaxID=630995 RepID=A0ABP8RSJ8_9PSEU